MISQLFLQKFWAVLRIGPSSSASFRILEGNLTFSHVSYFSGQNLLGESLCWLVGWSVKQFLSPKCLQLGTHSHLSGSNPKVLLTDWWVPQCFPRRNGKDSVEVVEVEEVVVVVDDREVDKLSVRRPYF